MEFVTGSPLGWFIGGIFIVAFFGTAWWMYGKIKARREKEAGKL